MILMKIYRLRKGEMMGNNEDMLIAAIFIIGTISVYLITVWVGFLWGKYRKFRSRKGGRG
jgi:hypothetical protein